uniref:hAT-like transposase RNase-H fold domain-containing protein n=1 Tax=Oryza sativa subsp. japonica TaxID=39947 RepID=Q6Z265_ORYSJ|nr:hypothetical protein [Oryza sativa Japonica Group]
MKNQHNEGIRLVSSFRLLFVGPGFKTLGNHMCSQYQLPKSSRAASPHHVSLREGESATVFYEIWAIKSTLDQNYSNEEDAGIVRMVDVMKRKFQDYWNISCLTLSVPVILDPWFKYSYVKFRFVQAFGDVANNKLSEVKKAIEQLFSDHSPKVNDQNNELTGGRTDIEAGILQENVRHVDWDKFLSEQDYCS